jgi:hypothetical protein
MKTKTSCLSHGDDGFEVLRRNMSAAAVFNRKVDAFAEDACTERAIN